MSSANEDSEHAHLTRGVYKSRRVSSTQQGAGASSSAPADDDSEDEVVLALEQAMAQGEGGASHLRRDPEENEKDSLARLLEEAYTRA